MGDFTIELKVVAQEGHVESDIKFYGDNPGPIDRLIAVNSAMKSLIEVPIPGVDQILKIDKGELIKE